MKDSTHEEVFGKLNESLFTLKEAAEYLEITENELGDAWVAGELEADVMFRVEHIRLYKKFNRFIKEKQPMRYSIVYGRELECDLESTICTNHFCKHPCTECGFSFEDAKSIVLNYYETKLKTLNEMKEDNWSNY